MRSRRQAVVPAALTVACLAAAVAVAAAASPSVSGVELAQSGHWVADKAQRTVLHVHGQPPAVDARVTVPGDVAQGAVMSLQGATEGFVVGRDRAWSFDKSTLQASAPTPLPSTGEKPVGIETLGGPYLVYRAKGTIVRLGQPPAVVEAGGPVGPPLRTADGTVWVHRPDNGTLCAIRRNALELDCSAHVAPGSAGGTTVVGGHAVFVDTAGDVAHLVRDGDQDPGAHLGSDLPPDTLLPDQATTARLPVVVPGANTLRLLDATGIPDGRPASPPVDVALGAGTFSSPLVSGDIIALFELSASTLSTFDATGRRIADVRLPPGTDPADARRGEDGRIYVDQPDGSRTDVVQEDGTISSLDLGLGSRETVAGAAPVDQIKPVAPPPPGQLIVPRTEPTAAPAPEKGRGPAAPNPGPGDGGTQTGPGTGPSGSPPVPPARPAPPAQVLAALEPSGQVTVTWADGGGGPVESYLVSSSHNDTVRVNAGKATFANLVAGETYTFTVVATNRAGSSAPSAPSNAVTLPAAPQQLPPDPPANVSATFAKSGTDTGTATVTWTTPDLHGGTLVRYDVVAGPSGTTRTTTGTSIQLAAPADFDCTQKVTFQVRTVASVGGVEKSSQAATAALLAQCVIVKSRLYLSPSSRSLKVGESITVTIMVAIGSKPVNAVQANVSFPPGVLDCTAVKADPGWSVSPEAACSGSEARIAVGKIPPPRTGTVAVGTVTFTALAPGTASLTFTSESAVLAHEDSSETLSSKAGGTYTVTQ